MPPGPRHANMAVILPGEIHVNLAEKETTRCTRARTCATYGDLDADQTLTIPSTAEAARPGHILPQGSVKRHGRRQLHKRLMDEFLRPGFAKKFPVAACRKFPGAALVPGVCLQSRSSKLRRKHGYENLRTQRPLPGKLRLLDCQSLVNRSRAGKQPGWLPFRERLSPLHLAVKKGEVQDQHVTWTSGL